jgi:hypothetical protein
MKNLTLITGALFLAGCLENKSAGTETSSSTAAPSAPISESLKGEKGDKGDTGDKGPTGDVGATGATGAVGAMGPMGPQGIAGVQGAIGPQGPMGLQGIQGIQGIAGVQGAPGLTGPTGPQGSAGVRGPDGNPGPNGGVAKEFWLARADGQLIAQVISHDLVYLFLWDDVNQMEIIYSSNYGGNQHVVQPVQRMFYKSADCSGQEYVEFLNNGHVSAGTGRSLGARLFKISKAIENTTMASRRDASAGGVLGACIAFAPITTNYFEVTEVIPNLPMVIPQGSYHVVRR